MNELLRDWLLDPLALLFLASLVLSLAFANLSFRWCLGIGLWVGLYLFVSAPAIVNPLLATLEDRFPDSQGCEEQSIIVVLGGGVDSRATDARDYGAMSTATHARISAARALLEQNPSQQVIVSGGGPASVSEAEVMQSYLQSQGISPGRITLESSSANTRQNAAEVAKLLKQMGYSNPIGLVSSALHMSRASGDFMSHGVEVCAIPVDRLRIKSVPAWALMPQTSALKKFDHLLHEVVALLAYRFL